MPELVVSSGPSDDETVGREELAEAEVESDEGGREEDLDWAVIVFNGVIKVAAAAAATAAAVVEDRVVRFWRSVGGARGMGRRLIWLFCFSSGNGARG